MSGASRFQHFVSVSAVLLGLALLLSSALGPLARERPGLALAMTFAVAVPSVVALTRLTQLGCGALTAAVALHLVARAVGRPALESLLLFAAPGWAFLGWALAVRPLLARLDERRALETVGATSDAAALAGLLGHASARVREQAARRLGSLFSPSAAFPLLRERSLAGDAPERAAAYSALQALARHPDGWALVRDLLRERVKDPSDAPAAEAALSLAQLDALGDLVASEAPGEARPAVRLAYAEGLLRATSASDGTGSRSSLAATLLAQVLGDPAAPDDVRAAALEAMDRVPGREVRAAACPLLVREQVTAELLWLFVDHGQPEDAPLLARWVASDRYDECNAAVEALDAIVDRAAAQLGPHAAPTREALRAGRDRLRAVHAQGDNRLADELVDRLAALDEALASSTPSAGAPSPPSAGAPSPSPPPPTS